MDCFGKSSELLSQSAHRRGIGALAGFFAAIAVGGCASGIALVFDPKVVSTPQIIEASGSKHDVFLGLHFVTTVSFIRTGHAEVVDQYIPVLKTTAQGWALQLLAPAGEPASVRTLLEHYRDIEAAFAQMTEEVSKVLPRIGKRRFVVRVIPNGLDYDNAWLSFALNEGSLGPLQFAYSGPESSLDTPAWANRLVVFLAHEAAHSYFWFHAPAPHNNFSEEVIAYTVQRCVADSVSEAGRARYPGNFGDMANQAAKDSPSAFYQTNRTRFPDSLIAQFVANALYDRKEKLRSDKEEPGAFSTAFCRYIASSGIDFTTAHDTAPILRLPQ
jgi:hypothetical protein